MVVIAGQRASQAMLHKTMSLALASCPMHWRLHDPDLVLAGAAADHLLERLAASGLVLMVAASMSASTTADSTSSGLQL